MLSPNVVASKYVPMPSGLKRVNPRDWEWEQGGKRAETKPLNQVIFSILGLVLSIFHYKHLIIWFSNLGCLALHNRDFLSPLPRGKQISPKEVKKPATA